jgi:hypothetical protein
MGNGSETSTQWKAMMVANAIQHTLTDRQMGDVLLRYFLVLKIMRK